MMAEKKTTEDGRTQSPQSVTRVISILEALCASAKPISLADLSRRLGTPKSSLSALLRGLADEDFVIAEEGAWRLGPGAFGLGSALIEARRRLQSSDLIRDGLRRLADRSGETVLFAVRDSDGDQMTYVDVVESRNSVRFAVSIGDRRPLYATAGGRALLASSSEVEVEGYLDRVKADALTGATLTGRRELLEAIDRARAVGFAQTVDQASEGVTGTAAVIRDSGGKTVGAMIIAAPSSRSQDRLSELSRLVMQEAAAVSRSLGYRESD